MFAICDYAFAAAPPAQNCAQIGLLGNFQKEDNAGSDPFGDEIRRGSELARLWLARALPGHCVRFTIVDINNTIANIDHKIHEANSEGISVFVGLGTSDEALAARKALAETGSVLITPTASSNALLSEPARTILLFPTNRIIAQNIVRELRRRKIRRVAAVYAENQPYSKDMERSFREEFAKIGGHLDEFSVRAGRVEIPQEFFRLNPNAAKFVFLPLFELDAAKVIAEIQRSGRHPVYLGTDSWGTYSRVIKNLVQKNTVRAITPEIYSPTHPTKSNTWFVRNYRKKNSQEPTDLAAFSFDAVRLAEKFSRNCSENARQGAITRCLEKILPLDSTMGELRFLGDNSLQRTVAMKTSHMGLSP